MLSTHAKLNEPTENRKEREIKTNILPPLKFTEKSKWRVLRYDIIHLRDKAMQVYRLKNENIGPVHTNAFSKECVFVVIEKCRSIRVYFTVFMRFRLSRPKRSKTINRIARCEVELYAHATDTRACYIFGRRFHFNAFSTVFHSPH